MTVQDDQREKELCRLFNLEWDVSHARGGSDANFDVQVGRKTFRIDVEVKSTTSDTVSTARDVGLEHIAKWRTKFWVIGFYKTHLRGPQLQHCICLSPADLEPWIAELEGKIKPDYELARRSSRSLTLDDLDAICGSKSAYDVADAKRLHKSQWSIEEYRDAQDVVVGRQKKISREKMLEILRLRAQYIAERGATLNNPHIGKKFLDGFRDAALKSNQATSIRKLAAKYISGCKDHPFPVVK
jgi:hypothetical protein